MRIRTGDMERIERGGTRHKTHCSAPREVPAQVEVIYVQANKRPLQLIPEFPGGRGDPFRTCQVSDPSGNFGNTRYFAVLVILEICGASPAGESCVDGGG